MVAAVPVRAAVTVAAWLCSRTRRLSPTTAVTSGAMDAGSRTADVVASPVPPPLSATWRSPVWNAASTAAALPLKLTSRRLADTPLTVSPSLCNWLCTAATAAVLGPNRLANCPRDRYW